MMKNMKGKAGVPMDDKISVAIFKALKELEHETFNCKR